MRADAASLALALSVVSPAPLGAQPVQDGSPGVVVRATRVAESPRVDGALTEEIYRSVQPFSAFLQGEPDRGSPVTERTEAWVLFDDRHLYISARCWDSQRDGWIANEMRRDGEQLRRNDSFGVLLDTFHDRRNAFLFYVNPIGGLADELITDERTPNTDWNTVWQARTGRFEGGWTVEIAIPFASLRYGAGEVRTWGINLRRIIRRKNEYAYSTVMPAAPNPLTAIFRVSAAATLVGLEPPHRGRAVELKPYAIAGLTTDRRAEPALSNDLHRDAGFEGKVGLSDGLTLDVTVNTDFAQVEVDEQQVNLTRFSLTFPEKREFFLEGRGIFDFGGARGGDTPQLFFSRRIGLSDDGAIPIHAGGRITGRVGAYSLGLLAARTGDGPDETPASDFAVVRVRRDVLRRSAVGVIFTNRSAAESGAGPAQTAGVDGIFSFFQNLNVNTYLAATDTPADGDDRLSYRAQVDYNADRYGLQLERLTVGNDFRPEVGFLRREAFERSSGLLRVSRRPTDHAFIRRTSAIGQLDYVTDRDGQLESRDAQASFDVELENSDRFTVAYSRKYELLDDPFAPGGVVVPAGRYGFQDIRLSYATGPQRPVSATVAFERGGFYGGTITTIEIDQGRVAITPRLSIEPSAVLNWAELPQGSFDTRLVRARASFTVTPRMFVSGLVQYNSTTDTLGSNLRLRWEYRPGSELFVVYTDERATAAGGGSGLRNRAVAVKINRLIRF